MIAIQLHDVITAAAFCNEAGAGVTLRFADDSRVTLHTVDHEQASAIAAAINSKRFAAKDTKDQS